jgi:primosomal protein N' (replication factor Y)
LVIIEEEQKWTYKSEKAQRYHARDTAEVLCRESHSKLVLGTGTPSLEAWAKVKGGQFHLATLDAGFSQPRVDVIDLTAATPSALYPFTPPLVEAIRERLAKHEQIILFLNRRGLASALLCFECRRRLLSPESQLPYTLHEDDSGKQLLVDHTTGITAPIPARCPSCGGADLRPIGAGTQRIERIVHSLFPSARLLRADRDVLHHPREMQRLLAAMERGEADILIGTQTVLKGLSLPRVTLAAVIVSDIGLSLPDFRAGERVFQCLCRLSQWSAESARRQVLIQTFCPLSPEISFGAQGAIEAYLDQELCVRFSTGYPPAEQMVRIILRGENTPQRAQLLSAHVQEVTRKRGTSVKVSCAPTFFGGGRIWQVLLRGSDLQKVLKELDLTGVSIDVDPIECL